MMGENHTLNCNPFEVQHPCMFREELKRLEEESPESNSETGEEAEREKSIICRACANVITSQDEAIEIEGKRVHKFVNPAGIIYRIGCFRSAPGCALAGEPTREFTWFPGYSWSFVFCRNCITHLGWHYTSGSAGFFGLILDKITENIA